MSWIFKGEEGAWENFGKGVRKNWGVHTTSESAQEPNEKIHDFSRPARIFLPLSTSTIGLKNEFSNEISWENGLNRVHAENLFCSLHSGNRRNRWEKTWSNLEKRQKWLPFEMRDLFRVPFLRSFWTLLSPHPERKKIDVFCADRGKRWNWNRRIFKGMPLHDF